MPEFLLIVSGSLHMAKKFPCVIQISLQIAYNNFIKVKKVKYLCGPNDWSTQPNYSGRNVEQVRAVETSWTEFKDRKRLQNMGEEETYFG